MRALGSKVCLTGHMRSASPTVTTSHRTSIAVLLPSIAFALERRTIFAHPLWEFNCTPIPHLVRVIEHCTPLLLSAERQWHSGAMLLIISAQPSLFYKYLKFMTNWFSPRLCHFGKPKNAWRWDMVNLEGQCRFYHEQFFDSDFMVSNLLC